MPKNTIILCSLSVNFRLGDPVANLRLNCIIAMVCPGGGNASNSESIPPSKQIKNCSPPHYTPN